MFSWQPVNKEPANFCLTFSLFSGFLSKWIQLFPFSILSTAQEREKCIWCLMWQQFRLSWLCSGVFMWYWGQGDQNRRSIEVSSHNHQFHTAMILQSFPFVVECWPFGYRPSCKRIYRHIYDGRPCFCSINYCRAF